MRPEQRVHIKDRQFWRYTFAGQIYAQYPTVIKRTEQGECIAESIKEADALLTALEASEQNEPRNATGFAEAFQAAIASKCEHEWIAPRNKVRMCRLCGVYK